MRKLTIRDNGVLLYRESDDTIKLYYNMNLDWLYMVLPDGSVIRLLPDGQEELSGLTPRFFECASVDRSDYFLFLGEL